MRMIGRLASLAVILTQLACVPQPYIEPPQSLPPTPAPVFKGGDDDLQEHVVEPAVSSDLAAQVVEQCGARRQGKCGKALRLIQAQCWDHPEDIGYLSTTLRCNREVEEKLNKLGFFRKKRFN